MRARKPISSLKTRPLSCVRPHAPCSRHLRRSTAGSQGVCLAGACCALQSAGIYARLHLQLLLGPGAARCLRRAASHRPAPFHATSVCSPFHHAPTPSMRLQSWKNLLSRQNLPMTIMGCSLAVFQQLTGINCACAAAGQGPGTGLGWGGGQAPAPAACPAWRRGMRAAAREPTPPPRSFTPCHSRHVLCAYHV